MSRPSWVEPTAIEGADGHSASGVHLAEGLVPPPLVAHELCAPPEARAPQPSTPRSPAPASGVVRVAAASEPAGDPYQRHLDDVVRAFFPGWDPRSPRASRPSRPRPPR